MPDLAERWELSPDRKQYTDLALAPVMDDETETREMFQSTVARAYLGKQRSIDRARRRAGSDVVP